MDSAPTVSLWLLGGMRAEGPGGPISLPGGRVRSLLAYLLLRPRAPQPRELLAELLWPDAAPGAARRSLAGLLYTLRRAVGPALITADPETIGLRPDALSVDAWEFERLAGRADLADLRRAADLYAGDLLPELYDDWLAAPRAALRDRYLAALLRLAEAEGSPADAAEGYRRLLAHDPLHEGACRGLMRRLASLGRRREALAAYAELAAALDSELGAPPEPDTRQLAEEIGRAGGPRPEARPAEPAFVGRTAERAALIAGLEQARSGRGGLAAVVGEAGVGKTRLLAELARAAGWRGWQVVWARAPQAAAPAPYAPLATALAAALPAPRLQQIAPAVQPLWLTMIAGVMLLDGGASAARSRHHQEALPAPLSGWESGTAPNDPHWLPVALGHVLTALAGVAPHLIILDDAQWADPALWPLLDELRPRLAGAPLLLLVCGRSEELAPAAWEALARWDAAGGPCLRLSGLSSGELAELAVAAGQPAPPPEELARLAQSSGGSPLLALMLLRSGEAALGQAPLAALLQRRLEGLSAAAAAALATAAALGSRFAYDLWERVVDAEAYQRKTGAQAGLPALALELEQAGLLILEPGGYRFAHDALRAYLYGRIGPAERRELHRRALAACPADDPLAALHHASEAGDAPAAAAAALAAAEHALAGFGLPAARRLFAQALSLLPAADLPRRYRALRGQLAALAVSDSHAADMEALDALEALARQIGEPRLQAEAATIRADRCMRSGHAAEAAEAAERARGLAGVAGDAGQEARALELIAQIARQAGDYRAAQAHLLAARARYQAAADPHGEATTAHNLALVAWAVGEHQGAIEGYARAAELFQGMGDLLNQARALNGLGCALWGLGAYPDARARHEAALAISRELDDRWGQATATLNLGQVALATGDYIAAIDRFAAALTGFRALGQGLGTATALSTLAQAYALLGDRAAALSYAAEALRASQAAGLLRIEGYAQHNRGLALLDWQPAGPPPAEAAQALRAACAIREQLGERENLAESRACLALALAAGHPVEAQAAAAAARADLAALADRAGLRQLVAYASYAAARAADDSPAALAHLAAAAAAMRAAAEALPASDRAGFLRQVPLNRATLAALDQHSRHIAARLVRADVPLGRTLTPGDYLPVRWTLDSPGDSAIPRADERRRQVIRRLLDEAAAQGAAPTDADLAQALGVSRRTILRDIEILAAEGVAIPTRRRR